ncbi:MAG: Peptidoglycan-binding domain 1 [Candidatus Taylorbacteria bacterium]|nr:Peptidoglycan-binding domain 1 [Candidatus Taylorbacteria bacterium]
MKQSKTNFTIAILLALIFIGINANITKGAAAAILTLESVGSIDSQITVYGDPYGAVELHYGNGGVVTLGSTDQNGYLRMAVNTASYNIACDQTAYALVNGQRTATIRWSKPDALTCDKTASTNGISFSQNNIVMTIGQSKSITINGTGGYSVTNNSSPVISSTITSSTLNLIANGFGGTSITVCDNSSRCGTLYVVAVNASDIQNVSINQCVTPTTNTTTSTTPTKFVFTKLLEMDSIGTEVTELQKKLTNLGFYAGPVTGKFGPLTETAVKKFQKEYKITQAGYVGPSTRAKLNQL